MSLDFNLAEAHAQMRETWNERARVLMLFAAQCRARGLDRWEEASMRMAAEALGVDKRAHEDERKEKAARRRHEKRSKQ